MRICHVSPHLPPDQAANALLPAELGRWSQAAGDEVSFLAHAPVQGRAGTVALAGPVTRLNTPPRPSRIVRALKIYSWQRARAIAAALDGRAADADLLHLHSNGLIVEVAAAWAKRRGKPFVLTLYGTEIWHYRRRWPIDPFTRAYRTAAAVTFYSRRLLERGRERGLERPHLEVIYPAVNPVFARQDEPTRAAWRSALGIAEPHVILNVKRLHELAGQRFLIDAFAKIARGRHDLRLVICGTGPLRQDLEDQARGIGVEKHVTFTGLVGNEDVARYCAIADVFALPSLLEALPTVAVEALASGTPVVSADHPGGVELSEMFGDEVIVVPKGNPDALAVALEESLRPPRRTRPETDAILRARFAPDAVHAAYRAVYARAVGSK